MRKEFIRDEMPEAGDVAYKFRHILIRDAAYNAMAKAERAELHEAYGSWLEEVGSQVFPGLHALQDAVLHAWRKAAETLQALPQDLLPRRRQAAELGIVIQRFLLLIGRKILVAAQPLSGVIALHLGLPARLLTGLSPFSETVLRRTRRTRGRRYQGRRRNRHRDGLQSRHLFVLPTLRFKILHRELGLPTSRKRREKWGTRRKEILYGFAVTSGCTARSSSTSKSE